VKIAISAVVVCVAFGLSMEEAHAGLCTKEVNQFERAIRHSSMPPDAGPTAPETIGAELDHQPTPASVRAGKTGAQSRFADLLANAKALDARGKHNACVRVLSDAKNMFDPQ
jgi:hypothetical protein